MDTTIITTAINVVVAIGAAGSGCVAVCSAVATKLPAPDPEAKGAYPALYAFVNAVALNFGHAKNHTAP